MCRRQSAQSLLHLEQKHQPVAFALVPMLADQSGQMQIVRSQGQANFLLGLAAGAGVRRFTAVLVQFASAGAPQTEIWLLCALHQKNLVLFVEAVEQRGDLVRHRHGQTMSGSAADATLNLPKLENVLSRWQHLTLDTRARLPDTEPRMSQSVHGKFGAGQKARASFDLP
jgi:hypothetical protein